MGRGLVVSTPYRVWTPSPALTLQQPLFFTVRSCVASPVASQFLPCKLLQPSRSFVPLQPSIMAFGIKFIPADVLRPPAYVTSAPAPLPLRLTAAAWSFMSRVLLMKAGESTTRPLIE